MLLRASIIILLVVIDRIVAEKCFKCKEVINIDSGDRISGNCDLSHEAARVKGVSVDIVRCDSEFCGLYSTIQSDKTIFMRECAGIRNYCKSRMVSNSSSRPNFCKVCKGNLCNTGQTISGGLKLIFVLCTAVLLRAE